MSQLGKLAIIHRPRPPLFSRNKVEVRILPVEASTAPTTLGAHSIEQLAAGMVVAVLVPGGVPRDGDAEGIVGFVGLWASPLPLTDSTAIEKGRRDPAFRSVPRRGGPSDPFHSARVVSTRLASSLAFFMSSERGY